MQFECFHVNRLNSNLPLEAKRYKALRLSALKQSPQSFSSTLDVESQFSDDVWLSRIEEPSKEHFVCAVRTKDELEWVGQVAIRGPIPKNEFQLPAESGQSETLSDEEQVKWQMLSLFVLPEYRGKGLAKRLCREVFRYLSSRYQSNGDGNQEPRDVLLRIMVKPDNRNVISMYQSLGFLHTGVCTLEEALRANGDADMIPEGMLPPQYTTRGGVVMTKSLRAQS